MHDEACATYEDMIINMQLGHKFLHDNFGVQPKIGWTIDPFGHSSTNARLFAEMGFERDYFVDGFIGVHYWDEWVVEQIAYCLVYDSVAWNGWTVIVTCHSHRYIGHVPSCFVCYVEQSTCPVHERTIVSFRHTFVFLFC